MNVKTIIQGVFFFLLLSGTLTLIYFSPWEPFFVKRFWEYFSEIALVTAALVALTRYFGKGEKFYLWCLIWLVALYFRDLHPLVWRDSRISGLPYYALILGAIASGWPWRKEIGERLRLRPIILTLWIATALLFVGAYLWDHGSVRHFFPEHRAAVNHFENYLEEGSEALGCALLFVSMLL